MITQGDQETFKVYSPGNGSTGIGSTGIGLTGIGLTGNGSTGNGSTGNGSTDDVAQGRSLAIVAGFAILANCSSKYR